MAASAFYFCEVCYNYIMDMFIPFGEVILAAVVHATLQLGLGALLLLYHASLGKHVRRKTRNLVDSYISGIGMLVFFLVCTFCFVLDRYFEKPLYAEELVIIVGMLIALAIAAWAVYYRRGKTTELWLPRTVARFIDRRAKATNSNTEAFSLGLLTSLAEMPFTLVLAVVAANSIMSLPSLYQLLAVALYTIIAIIPLVVLRIAIRKGKTVVDIQRWRVKNKAFLKLITGVGFLVLGIFVFAFEVLK